MIPAWSDNHWSPRARELRKRKRFFEQAASLVSMVVVETGGHGRFLVRTDDLHIGRSLFVSRSRPEIETLELARAQILRHLGAQCGDTIIDVGANIGTTTIPALLSGGFERALSIEPESENFHNLTLNLRLNQVDSCVTAVEAAASNFEGSAHLVVARGRSGKHRVTASTEVLAEHPRVHATTIDAEIRRAGIQPEDVGLLWADAEGSEDRVLLGAEATLASHPPAVLEVNPLMIQRSGGSQAALAGVVERHYSHFVVLDPRLPTEPAPQPVALLSTVMSDKATKPRKRDLLLLQLAES